MSQIDLLQEILTTYRKHGWVLRRVLLTKELEKTFSERSALADATVQISDINAVWFSRPSHDKREAWELRFLSEAPYALFETFEGDESEEQREEMRQEMEARMREYASR
ncbi:MAG TPA: hypothetical protein VN643_08955 [Pyrinomonadaceae bacterium]|nr:hypothetical protein [Pyrinomonadaceae bacterium]